MTLSKEQIEVALKDFKGSVTPISASFDEQYWECEIDVLTMQTIIKVLQERLGSVIGIPASKPNEALVALGSIESCIYGILSLAKRNGVTELSKWKFKDDVQKIRAALQRNDVPQGWNTNMDEAPKGVAVLVKTAVNSTPLVARIETDNTWRPYCFSSVELFPVEWMPLPEAPKPTGE